MGTIDAEFLNNIIAHFDDSTKERIPIAPVVFYDDFLGDSLDARWATVEVNLNTAIGLKADTANGWLTLSIDADSNAEDAVLHWGDQRAISIKNGAVFECRLDMSTLPTSGTTVVFGMANDHNLDKDTVAGHAWFRLDGSGALDVESDDGTNDNDDVTTAVTLVAGTPNVFRIDFNDISDVKFYVDGVQKGTGTTFDMSNLSDANAVFQPYFSLDKASGTSVGTMDIDFVRIWSERAAV